MNGTTTSDASTDTVENVQTVDAVVGSVLKNRITVNVNSRLPNDQKLNTVISARIVDDKGSGLTGWTDVKAKSVKISSRLHIGVKARALHFNGITQLSQVFPSLKGQELGKQFPVLLQIQTEAKSFRKDSSLKGVFAAEGAKINFDIEKMKQAVRYYDENDWINSGSNLKFENLGGSVIRGTFRNGEDASKLYLNGSFTKNLTYFKQNGLSDEPQGQVNFNRNNGWDDYVYDGIDVESIADDKHDVKPATIYNSGQMDINKRDANSTVSGNILGYQMANSPLVDNLNGNKTVAKNYYPNRGYEPLTAHFVVTNAENDYDTKDGKLNPNHRNNSVQTFWQIRVSSVDYKGKNYPMSESDVTSISLENDEDGSFTYRTAWEDPRTLDAFGEVQIGDDHSNHYGGSFTYAGDLATIHVAASFNGGARGKVHRGLIKWNPKIATIYEGKDNPAKILGLSPQLGQAWLFDQIRSENRVINQVSQIYPFLILRESGIGSGSWFDTSLMRVLTGFTSGYGQKVHINDMNDFRYGVKKNTDYSLDTIQNADYEAYDWYQTYDEAKSRGVVSAFDYERKQPDTTLFRFATPLLQLTNQGNGTNIVDGDYTTAAAFIYEKQDDGSWKRMGGDDVLKPRDIIPAKWSSEGVLEQYQAPSRTSLIKADTIALKPAVWTIRYNDKQSDLQLPESGETKMEWRISGLMGEQPLYRESNLKTSIHFPKGINYKLGSAYLVNEQTGEKVSIETNSPNDIHNDRDLVFNLPTITNITSKNWILGYDVYVDQSLVAFNNSTNIYSSGLQYASVYWSDYKEHPSRLNQTPLEGAALAGQAATYGLQMPLIEKTAIIDEITPAYGELNSSHIVTVRPYSTISKGETGVAILTKIPTSGFNGRLTLESIEATNSNLPYDVYVSSTSKTYKNATDVNMAEFKSYSNTSESGLTYVLIKLKALLTRTNPIEFKFHMTTNGNQGGDIYRYQSHGNTGNHYAVDYESNIVTTRIIERKLSGVVWHDVNKNGLFDEMEERFTNKDVELVKDDQVLATTKTDNKGYYEFSKLPVGTYLVRLKDYPNSYKQWVVTQPQLDKDTGNKADQNAVVSNISLVEKNNVDVDRSDHHNIGLYKSGFTFKVVDILPGLKSQDSF